MVQKSPSFMSGSVKNKAIRQGGPLHMKDTQNIIELSGYVKETPQFSYLSDNGSVYETYLFVERNWGKKKVDEIRVRFNEKVIDYDRINSGQFIHVVGQIRTRIVPDGYLEVFIWAKKIELLEEQQYQNRFQIEGVIAKPIELRETPARHIKIGEITLEVISRHPKKIPCIAWEKIAQFCYEKYKEGDRILAIGFVQSRRYKKKIGGQWVKKRLLNELSIYAIRKIGDANAN